MISPCHGDTLHFMSQLASDLQQVLDGSVHLDLEAGREADEDSVHRPEVMDNPLLIQGHFLRIIHALKEHQSLVTGGLGWINMGLTW